MRWKLRTLPPGSARLMALIAIISLAFVAGGCSGDATAGEPARPVRLLINPANPTIGPGETLQLAAVVRYSDGSARQVTGQTHWRSSNPQVVSIEGGVAVGGVGGSATVHATYRNRSAATRIAVQDATNGPLQVSGANPRYFEDSSGRIVYLAGLHTWADLIDSGPSDPPPRFNYTAFLNTLQTNGLNVFRLWTWEQARWTAEINGDYWFDPTVYVRTGPGRANDGKLRFDLTQFNPAYFERMRDRVIAARDRGIYVIVMLFDGWSLEAKGPARGNPWPGHPFNADNNVNGIDGDPNGDDAGTEIHTLAIPEVTQLQDAYVRRVVDAVGDQPNLLYEISNESDTGSLPWQNHMVGVIQDYERSRPMQHPIGITAEYPGGENRDLIASRAAWISPNGDVIDPPSATGRKVILLDSDHLCGICDDPRFPWFAMTRGTNPLYMDIYDGQAIGLGALGFDADDSAWEVVRRRLGASRIVARRLDLAHMTPRGDLASSGFCLADPGPGGVYLVYLPNEDPVRVDLRATRGKFRAQWINPDSGFPQRSQVIQGGRRVVLRSPLDSADAVLLLRPVAR